MGNEIPVLDKGFVRLDDSMAGDLSVVNSARVSFAKRSEYDMLCDCQLDTPVTHEDDVCWPYIPRLKHEDEMLIRFLMRGRHGTPFEHNAFRFHVKAPIFVAREWMRHRIGSFNEWSGRYSKLEGEFYLPALKDMRTQVGKPGSYTFEQMPSADAHYARNLIEHANIEAWSAYENMLEDGVAKEIARLALPVNIYTQFYWTINARSLMNFLSLRNADAAMFEIREYAKVVEEIFAEKMPVTHDAFIENGRVAP